MESWKTLLSNFLAALVIFFSATCALADEGEKTFPDRIDRLADIDYQPELTLSSTYDPKIEEPELKIKQYSHRFDDELLFDLFLEGFGRVDYNSRLWFYDPYFDDAFGFDEDPYLDEERTREAKRRLRRGAREVGQYIGEELLDDMEWLKDGIHEVKEFGTMRVNYKDSKGEDDDLFGGGDDPYGSARDRARPFGVKFSPDMRKFYPGYRMTITPGDSYGPTLWDRARLGAYVNGEVRLDIDKKYLSGGRFSLGGRYDTQEDEFRFGVSYSISW